MGQVLSNCEPSLCDSSREQHINERGVQSFVVKEALKNESLFIQLERVLHLHEFYFQDIEDVSNLPSVFISSIIKYELVIISISQHLKSVSKYGALTKHQALEGFKRAGVITRREIYEVYNKFLITFEKTQGSTKLINLSKLLTSVLLLTKDNIHDKVNHLFGIYGIGTTSSAVVRRANVRQILDHLCFAVIYAIPNLAYHHQVPGFGANTEKCNRVMDIKLDMQKKVYFIEDSQLQVYNDKQNLFKVIMGQQQILPVSDLKTAFLKPMMLKILSTSEIRKRLTPIIVNVSSRIVKGRNREFRRCFT